MFRFEVTTAVTKIGDYIAVVREKYPVAIRSGIDLDVVVMPIKEGCCELYRVTYLRPQKKVQIECQQMNVPMFLNRTHFRHGYTQPFAASLTWAVIVDLVIVALVFWVLSGLWMWWEIKPARAWGAVFGLAGAAVFALLLFTI